MPTINLIGEDEEKEKERKQPEAEQIPVSPEEPDASFATETFSLETQEYAPQEPRQEPKLAEPVTPKLTTPPPDLSSFRRPPRGSRASLFLVVGFLVVVVALLLFWQLQKGEAPPSAPGGLAVVEKPGVPAEGEVTSEPEAVAEQPVTEEPPGPPPATPPPRAISPGPGAYVRETAGITAAVTSLLEALPEDLNFTLISFTGNRFLLEYVASTENAALSFPDLLSEAMPIQEIRILTREQMAANGQSLPKVLLQGSVSLGSLGSPAASIQYLDAVEVRREVSRLAQAAGMVLRSVETRPDVVEDGFEMVPIDFRLSGKKASATAFLGSLGQAELNLRINKLVLVSADRRGLSDEEVNLAINANTYRPR